MRNSINIGKLTVGILLIGILFGFKNKENDVLKFSDNFGNKFLIEDTESIPKRLNPDFLKENLSGNYFVKDISESNYKFKFYITEIDRINRNNYRLRVMRVPQTKNINEIIRYKGYSHYLLRIKKAKNGIELQSIEFMYMEI